MYVILEMLGKPSVVVESSDSIPTLMQQYGVQRAFAGEAYNPETINHNHLQSTREFAMWAVIKPTENGYDVLGISHLPVVNAVNGEVICLQLKSETTLENGEYVVKVF